MRKYYSAFSLIALLIVTACASPEERAAEQAKIDAADNAECAKLGFKPGTENFGNCILKLREIRAQERASRYIYDPYPRFGVDYSVPRGY